VQGRASAVSQQDWALLYIESNFAVFPVKADKRPLTPHGFRDATRDPPTIKRWWTHWPHADIAGVPPPSIVIFDLDQKNGVRGIADFTRLDGRDPRAVETPTACTVNGGLHLLFAAGGRAFRHGRIPGTGIDLIVHGKSAAVLPGARNGRRWLKWTSLAEAPSWASYKPPEASPPGVVAGPQSLALTPYAGDTCFGRAALRSACRRILRAHCGYQEATLNSEAFSIGQLVGGGELDGEHAVSTLIGAAERMPAYRPHEPWSIERLEEKVARAIEAGRARPRVSQTRATIEG